MEEWKPVIGLEGKYEVSNLGRVASLNYRRSGKRGLMLPRDNGKGYFTVYLWEEGKPCPKLIHRLVAQAFIDNPENLLEVNHIDEDKSNNQASNLEWCTRQYNINYGTGTARATAKISKEVIALDGKGKIIHRYKSTRDAGRDGFTQTSVAACCRGKRKSHKGLIWRYAN